MLGYLSFSRCALGWDLSYPVCSVPFVAHMEELEQHDFLKRYGGCLMILLPLLSYILKTFGIAIYFIIF